MQADQDTIAAIATPLGRGGIGVIRVSGPRVPQVVKVLLKKKLPPRKAVFAQFLDKADSPIDEGIALYFPAPNSFTGEDVLELQGHGGPVILDMLLQRLIQLGVRLARPGEFSERAFLNDKIDLSQAEAIADLIDASSQQAARGALRSLQGEFSHRIHALVDELIRLRTYVEAAIDFPEEEVDFLADGKVAGELETLLDQLQKMIADAGQGALLQEGMTIVIAGEPNAGKSSLLNALSGRDAAIVTEIAGTTRDVLRERIHIDGMPLHIIDTAGLRDSADQVEQEGIRRAWAEIEKADRILFVIDSTGNYSLDPEKTWPALKSHTDNRNISFVLNKIDLSGQPPGLQQVGDYPVIALSAKNHQGMKALQKHLKDCMGFSGAGEGLFTARRRHLEALDTAKGCLLSATESLKNLGAGELVAEDLRLAQQSLGTITGEFTSDDLLGHIFSSFCIGK